MRVDLAYTGTLIIPAGLFEALLVRCVAHEGRIVVVDQLWALLIVLVLHDCCLLDLLHEGGFIFEILPNRCLPENGRRLQWTLSQRRRNHR